MRYRRRLRSRIVISFGLFGMTLTALFALAVIGLRGKLEDQLINTSLQDGVNKFLDFKREHPEEGAQFPFSPVTALIVSERKFANVPFAWQKYGTGVYDIREADERGRERPYKLAVRKESDLWAFYRYDVAKEELGERQLIAALVAAVVAFSVLAFILGFWSARRVMRPVADLAERLHAFRSGGSADDLAPHFANDEVGELAAALDDYRARLTEMVERDREFNADVSHELRTPLAVIATTTELLLGGPNLTEKLRDRLKRIERASRQSAELTDALLLLSRRQREAPSDGETTDVGKIAAQVIENNRTHLASKPVEVSLVTEDLLEVVAPSSVVAVALTNLIGNAFKYTAQGQVIVRVGEGKVVVEDSGPGIREEDAELLFQRGYRGTGATGKGAGLGLAIVRRLCELYDWKVSLRPRPQGGAAATLDFRLRR
ncbi:MAG: HAMP domain-containing sensor histidine kinase [Tahibacter sp.]